MVNKPPRRFKPLAVLVGAIFVVLIGIQVIRPELTNPTITADLQVPPQVKQILRTSCYNCHSNETKLPWFDQIAPAYWIVVHDVTEGRKHLNFSEIGKLPAAQQKGTLFEAVSQIQLGAMPLPAYRRVHPDSTITPEQLQALKAYLNPPTPLKAAGKAEIAAATAQYDQWIHANGARPDVQPTSNGIAFLPEYKDWKAISSTDRFDNHTMRVILGNDVAIKAIAANQINPWPDGTTFAKVAWAQQPDGKGEIRTGAFIQVEFMIRDSKKYASTLGWGWARWRGMDLKPYGKDASFTKECVGCHNPMRKTNYVFTMPIRGQQ